MFPPQKVGENPGTLFGKRSAFPINFFRTDVTIECRDSTDARHASNEKRAARERAADCCLVVPPNGQARRGTNRTEISDDDTAAAIISGDDTAAAIGVTARSISPVLALCRLLVEKGVDPATPLEAWRGPVSALWVRAIGEAARLETDIAGFKPRREPETAPLVRQTARPGVEHRAKPKRAHGAPSRRAAP
jgi:hypothetical protein